MLSRHLQLLLFLLIFMACLRTADACSCGGKSTVIEAYNYADVVVIATAVSVEKAAPAKTASPGRVSDEATYVSGVTSTSMRVEQVFKGTSKVGDEMVFFQGDDLLYLNNLDKVRNKTRISGTLRFHYETNESLAAPFSRRRPQLLIIFLPRELRSARWDEVDRF